MDFPWNPFTGDLADEIPGKIPKGSSRWFLECVTTSHKPSTFPNFQFLDMLG